ncbi:right-handed parallel beta-helix repeat-containing protein [Humibacillus sp. DSM 29435]|uniref:right-handed parallel beta-helix repeat-containing protein n=1 Tax=Humibacillus sp. DSM 29435 TaxID=1869167 RepID=UPI000B1EF33B|nr:right-handed parallel beta-helix repeat-containing protein [Humibacillus sp. DSM 29435]
MITVLHVATTGSDQADGSAASPFRTIGRAAELARAGDRVVVREGEYREWVRPARGGLSDLRRITYEAAEGAHVVIKGSERVTGWKHTGEVGTVWTVEVPNALFGSFNPFAEEVVGDWVVRPIEAGARKHLGDVYLDGRSFYEVGSREEVSTAARHDEIVDDWTSRPVPVADADQTTYVWHAQVGSEATTIWANFHDADPNERLVEINVRRSVFYPTEHHVDYITVRGFELCQAATPWAPPTADQPGLIGPNWAKGWVIEDNLIHDAKCVAVSIGKEASTGDNNYTLRGDKPGYQYQLESVFSAQQIGWDQEHIGSHVIRRNTIYDCGQCAIAGHLGCVFSTIEDNHIYRIALKREFYGHEIAGIKLHAAIDVEITHNRIHSCSLGIWLDWQTQGTRVARNLLYDNSRDLFVEVSHGPYVIDHNILASPVSIESFSQGGAYVGNLVCGTLGLTQVMDRATPYHRPHSTQVAGYAVIYGADDRWVGNLFAGGEVELAYGREAHTYDGAGVGTAGYDGHPSTFEDYLALIDAQPPGDHNRFPEVPQAVYIRHNAYAGAATAYAAEEGPLRLDRADFTIIEEADAVFLEADLPPSFEGLQVTVVTGADLPRVRFVDADFEERDGSPVTVDRDLLGERKNLDRRYPAGPIATLSAGTSRIRVW